MSALKEMAKPLVPAPLLKAWSKFRLEQIRRAEHAKPLQDIFTAIYSTNRWGGKPGEFYSGSGSDDPIISRYVDGVRGFIVERGIGTVVDIGCGDFRVGSKIANPNIQYTGIDIVAPLIAYNTRMFGSATVRFADGNAVADELPRADLCLIREVLQHLSNAQIATIIGKLGAYKYVLMTDVRPTVVKVPNEDKTAGSATRRSVNSCIMLNQPPFSMKNVSLLFESPAAIPGAMLCTYLIVNPTA